MLDEKRMLQLKDYGGDAALAYRAELVEALREKVADTTQAVSDYFSDRKRRQQAIEERIKDLKEQQTELEAKVGDYAPRLAEATICGNSAALGVIQQELTQLEAGKAAIAAQIELLSGVSVAGDEGLFHEADAKAQDLAAFWSSTQTDLASLSAFASEQVALWSQVAKVSDLGGDIMPRRSIFGRVEEMRKDITKGSANNE